MRRTLVFVLALVVPALTQAQTPSTTRLVPHSGTALDARGAPASGDVVLTLELFENEEGGEPLWRETQQARADERGRYLVYLGSVTTLPQAAFATERARWLAVSVDGRAARRVVLAAVPYALRAADADTLGGEPASTYVRSRPDGRLATGDGLIAQDAVDGTGVAGQLTKWISTTAVSSSVLTESASNRIGLGLPDPTGGGVVDSVFTIRNFDNNTGFAVLNQAQARRFALNTLANGGWTLYDGGTSTWNQGLAQINGRVGLGTTSPTYKLQVVGGATRGIWGETTADFAVIGHVSVGNGTAVLGESVSGTGMYAWSSSGTGLRAEGTVGIYVATGNVGVGTPSPADKLHVVGDARVGTGTTGCVKDADATVIAGVCSSDRRLKQKITPFGRALENVARLQPVHFFWRADEYADRQFGTGQTFGLIAQDVEEVLPELVTTDEQGYKAVKYNALPLHMLQAIKELKAENDALKLQLQSQEDRLRRLEEAKQR